MHASLDLVLWVINAYVLAYAALLVVCGRLGDLYGQRELLAVGLVVFTGASFACGVAQNIDQLIAFRVVQAIGGALLTPQTLAIPIEVFRPSVGTPPSASGGPSPGWRWSPGPPWAA